MVKHMYNNQLHVCKYKCVPMLDSGLMPSTEVGVTVGRSLLRSSSRLSDPAVGYMTGEGGALNRIEKTINTVMHTMYVHVV